MRIPRKIQQAIYKCAKFNEKAKICEMEIIKFMQDMKITEDTASCVTRNLYDAFIDCCHMSNNPEYFIQEIENLVE